MQIIKMDKSIQDLNKIEASFCNCSKPNVVSQMNACILQQKLGTRLFTSSCIVGTEAL